MIKKIIKKTDKGKQTKKPNQTKNKNQEDKKYKVWICLYLSIYQWIIR